MKTLSILFAVALVLSVVLGAQAPSLNGRHFYSSVTNLEQSELEMLRSAKKSVDIAMYSFTDREIAKELVDLARSGVKIRVYRDRTEYPHELERSDLNTTAMLIAAGDRGSDQRSKGPYAFGVVSRGRLRSNRVRDLVADSGLPDVLCRWMS